MARTCNRCGRSLPESEFYPRPRGLLTRSCKKCISEYNRTRWKIRREDPELLARNRENGRDWYEQNKDRTRVRLARNHRQEREEAIDAYGRICACCGEDRFEFLAIDHIDGGGHAQRKMVGGKMARWLKRQGFPTDVRIRVLCHNCNLSLGFYGYCPHQPKQSPEQQDGALSGALLDPAP